jgi:hypothetical protein
VPRNPNYGPGLADFIVPLPSGLILNEHFIVTFISAQSINKKKLNDVPFIPHTRLPIHCMSMKKPSYFRVGGTRGGGGVTDTESKIIVRVTLFHFL